MKKNRKITFIIAIIVCVLGLIFALKVNRGDISNVNRISGYSALYSEELINKAFDEVEKTFAKEFKGCKLTELRYDEEVENKFAEKMMKSDLEKGRELIILLSEFDTDENGGDGGFNPNDTYANWQWHLERTSDKKDWEVIGWGY